jgi:O-antigen/teichoic acid export membrane protein
MAGRGLGGAAQVTAAMVMAHALGTAGWGAIGLLLSTMEIVRVLVNFGLDTVAVRSLALGDQDAAKVVRRLVVLKGLLWAAVFSALVGLSTLSGVLASDPTLLLLLGLGLLPGALSTSLAARFQAGHRMDRLVPVSLVTAVAYLGAVLTASRMGASPAVYVAIIAGNDFFAAACTWIVSRWTFGPSPRATTPGPSGAELWALFAQGVPVGLVWLMVVLYSRLGILLLKDLSGIDSVGLYYTAVRVCEPILMVAGAFAATVYPVLSRRAGSGAVHELKRRFIRYSLLSCVVSIGAGVLITLLASTILETIRPEYLPARGALIALTWATVFMFQNQLTTMVVNAFGKFHFVTAFAAFNLCVFLTLGWVLIPRFGPLGAGLSTLGTEALNCAVQLTVVGAMLRNRARFPG